jgi:hypothetical protein
MELFSNSYHCCTVQVYRIERRHPRDNKHTHRLVEGGNKKRKGGHSFPSHRLAIIPLVGRFLVFVKDNILGKDKLVSAVAIVNIGLKILDVAVDLVFCTTNGTALAIHLAITVGTHEGNIRAIRAKRTRVTTHAIRVNENQGCST